MKREEGGESEISDHINGKQRCAEKKKEQRDNRERSRSKKMREISRWRHTGVRSGESGGVMFSPGEKSP